MGARLASRNRQQQLGPAVSPSHGARESDEGDGRQLGGVPDAPSVSAHRQLAHIVGSRHLWRPWSLCDTCSPSRSWLGTRPTTRRGSQRCLRAGASRSSSGYSTAQKRSRRSSRVSTSCSTTCRPTSRRLAWKLRNWQDLLRIAAAAQFARRLASTMATKTTHAHLARLSCVPLVMLMLKRLAAPQQAFQAQAGLLLTQLDLGGVSHGDGADLETRRRGCGERGTSCDEDGGPAERRRVRREGHVGQNHPRFGSPIQGLPSLRRLPPMPLRLRRRRRRGPAQGAT